MDVTVTKVVLRVEIAENPAILDHLRQVHYLAAFITLNDQRTIVVDTMEKSALRSSDSSRS